MEIQLLDYINFIGIVETPASNGVERQGLYLSAIVDANGTSDYFSVIAYADVGSGDSTVFTTNNFAFFAGEKLII